MATRRRGYLLISTVCFILSVIGVLLMGCATTRDYVQPTCVPRAIYQAVGVAIEWKVPVRIVISGTSNPRIDHAHAEAFINGRWVYLDQYSDTVFITDSVDVAPEYLPLVPYKYLSVSEIIGELTERGRLK